MAPGARLGELEARVTITCFIVVLSGIPSPLPSCERASFPSYTTTSSRIRYCVLLSPLPALFKLEIILSLRLCAILFRSHSASM